MAEPTLEAKWYERTGFDSEQVPVFDPAAMTEAQQAGDRCVSCAKRWPRPTVRVGRIPNGGVVRACPECAPPILMSTHVRAVRRVLLQAEHRIDRCAPNALKAIVGVMPARGQSRALVETAAILVARHIADTEDLGGAHLLPRRVLRWEQAHAWLGAWSATRPPAAVIREVVAHVLRVLPQALADFEAARDAGTGAR